MRFRHETDIMGCTSSMSRRNSEATSFRLILVGLDGAGKTSLLYKLSLGDFVTTKPTLGFNVETISYNNNTITLWDMGGTPSIRRLWKHYYLNCHGMIFVIDGSARDRLQDADDLLTSLLMEKELHGIPMVFLANKKDIEGALTEKDVIEYFCLDEISNRLCTVQRTSALTGEGIEKALDNMISFRRHIERMKA
ncbi:uncharacterized protein LOC128163145 isoform X1 [Crassostrea angulata]|uniref:uncharacterized protein LOC128163145 isoform X1 n=1 Tax=Magallana angulata TaxID=2784310 RepID=UPI0022B1FACC|nr:uncharacterized protein LOC128163145 isoform X1 [Crassostrea angulata]